MKKTILFTLIIVFVGISIFIFLRSNSSIPAKDKNLILEEFSSYTEGLIRVSELNGAIILASNDTIVLSKAMGYANTSMQNKNNLQTKFNAASLGKMFTALAVGELISKNKINLEDKVGKYLKDLSNNEIKTKVTIKHLLSHTSGIQDFMGPYINDSKKDSITALKEYLPYFINQPLNFKPGSKWQYSNSGYLMLGLIIEKVSNTDYFVYMNNLFKTLEMHDTLFLEKHELVSTNAAYGYTQHDMSMKAFPEPKENSFMLGRKGSSAGGLYTTVEDLYKFSKFLKQNKDSDNYILKTLIKPVKNDYALGFKYTGDGACKGIGHSGGFPGVNAEFKIYPKLKTTLIALANDDFSASNLARGFERIVQGKPVKTPIALDKKDLKKYEGKYRFINGRLEDEVVNVEVSGNSIVIENTFILKPLTKSLFYDARDQDVTIQFKEDEGNKLFFILNTRNRKDNKAVKL